MSADPRGRPLIPKQPECNVGTSGHVDHGKCVRWDQYVILDGMPVTGEEVMNAVTKNGAILKRVHGGDLYELQNNLTISVASDFTPVHSRSLFYVEEYSGPLYNIRSKTGRFISVTPNHPLLINRNGKILWERAKDLAIGDCLAFLSFVPLPEEFSLPDFMPNLRHCYEVVTWDDFENLRRVTDEFRIFASLTAKDFEKLRILGRLSNSELSRRARIDFKTYRELVVGRRPLTPSLARRLNEAFTRIPLQVLQPREFLATQRKGRSRSITKLKDADIDADFAKWFAFVWSEGSSTSTMVDVTQTIQVRMLKEFLKISKEKFGVTFYCSGGGTYRACSKAFVDYLRFKFLFNPGNKFKSPVASWICRIPRDLKAIFLRWYFTLDGEFNNHSGQILISQANEKNMVIISYLLQSFGIVPNFGKTKHLTKKGEREYSRIQISGRRNLSSFAKQIGFEDERIQAKLLGYLYRTQTKNKETDLSIPVDVSSLRALFQEIGMKRESFRREDWMPTMKGSSWYKAYESAVRTGRISRAKLLLLIQSVEEQVLRVQDSLRRLDAAPMILRDHLKLIGMSLQNTANELGISRKRFTRLLTTGRRNELEPILALLRDKTRVLLGRSLATLTQIRNLARSPLEFDRITSVELENYEGRIFDLTVPDYANFIAGKGAIVSHNTSLLQAITGVWASAHSEELRRGITIKVGYADAAFYKCPYTPPPSAYSTSPTCPVCKKETKLLRAVSFVDCPGHESLMTNMLAGAFLMDGALLVIAANEPVPRPQTREHLQALQMLGMKRIVVVQNKIDLVNDEEAAKNYDAIKAFLGGTIASDAPIIPVSAQHRINVDALIEAIEQVIPTPKREVGADPLMYVVRSFDVNKPGIDIAEISGGVLGGSLVRGALKVGDEVEVLPGMSDERGRYTPVTTRIVSLGTGAGITEKVGPGGLVAVGTELDPANTKGDQMVGSVIGKPGSLPEVLEHVTLNLELFDSAVGSAELAKVEKVRAGEALRLNLGTGSTLSSVTSARDHVAELDLKKPLAVEPGSRASISRRIADRWRLIGSGVLK